jgi:hypothetical protein
MTTGIRERIKKAKSQEEINQLLREGQNYPMASEKTKRQWKRTASQTLETFGKPKKSEKSEKKPEKEDAPQNITKKTTKTKK